MHPPGVHLDTRSGGCHCGAVRYALQGPVANATLCHCSLCRATTGAPAVAWCSVETSRFGFTHGQPRSYRSTPHCTRTFCGTCGTQLTFQQDGDPGIDITTASLDDPGAPAVAPRDQTYARSELPWMHSVPGLPRFLAARDASCGESPGAVDEDDDGGEAGADAGHRTRRAAPMNALLATIQALEVELHHPGVRCDAQRLEQLLHVDFHEVGRSGRKYDRATVVRFLGEQVAFPPVISEHFALQPLGPDIVLLTYRSALRRPDATLETHTLRSSVWVQQGGQHGALWQLIYHQGTPAAEAW